jgi:hypothetical protein
VRQAAGAVRRLHLEGELLVDDAEMQRVGPLSYSGMAKEFDSTMS